ncbi:AAA family ATPase [Streptomyces sp. NPDC048002]|uniref:AAA family ATPase n=1 Tax=unclassified Streptomyces TaxID=2593676 RepID=UPI003405B563
MTAPLTPPPPPRDQSANTAWQQPPVPGGGLGPHPSHWPAPAYGDDGPGMRTELREAAVVAVAVAAAGLLLGVLWSWLAPRVPLVGDVVDGGWVVYIKDTEGEQAIGVEGTFTLLALAFGAVSALVVFLVRRRGGVPLVVALAVGGFLGSLLAWRVGVWLGPSQDVIARAQEVGKGVTFSAPLELNAEGTWLVWSIVALVVHLGLTGLFGPRDPDPYEQQYGGKDGYGAPSA